MTVEYAHGATVTSGTTASGESFRGEIFAYDADAGVLAAVSYTHLTLPTIHSV